MPLTPDQLNILKPWHEQQEGVIPYLYLDTKGNPTCGIGHLCLSWYSALRLPFFPSITAPEFVRLKSSAPAMRAEFYAGLTLGRLNPTAIDLVWQQDIANAEQQLVASFLDFAIWPAPAIPAAVDIVFNLGIGTLLRDFPRLTAALKTRDWTACAQECHREGIAEARNAQVKAWFEEAAEAAKGAITT